MESAKKAKLIKVKVTKEHKIGPTKYQLLCYRTLGKYAKKLAKPELEKQLIQAHFKILPEEYTAYALMSSILAALAGVALSLIIVVLASSLKIALLTTVLIPLSIMLPFIIFAGTYTLLMSAPKSKAKSRAKDMNRKLPYAMNFISAMASADVNIDVIFRELAKEKIYGEIAKESAWITRDVDLLGKDIVTALRSANERAPSIMFQDFLQGLITTVTSGGRLKPYFVLKADQYMKQHRMEQKKFQHTLGILAESFVTVVVAAPLFLIVMMSMMALTGGGAGAGKTTTMFLYIIVYFMIPISQFLFIFIIKTMTPEVG
ncbi:MAG: type II secretion system F family protein [Candidatus Thermoplasmatota archaeon]|nr:type II secretion system F family protein [Candidatus Thermoplasmatota archaeon]